MMDYFNKVGDMLYTLRLISEGACDLFETDAQPLFRLALQHEKYEATIAFDTIGAALTDMRVKIRALQLEHTQEAVKDHGVKTND